jgi:hypothetical protein
LSAASVPRLPTEPQGIVSAVRVLFATYLLIVASGLAVYIAIGLAGR